MSRLDDWTKEATKEVEAAKQRGNSAEWRRRVHLLMKLRHERMKRDMLSRKVRQEAASIGH